MPNAFAHIELNTENVPKAKKFYKAVFDWQLRDLPKFRYTIIDVGGGTGGGMQEKPVPEAPTAWLPYVQVDDLAKTLAKAEKAGGCIALDSTDIGDMGAIGVFIDPAGATLGVWQAAKPAPEKASKKKASKKKTAAKKTAAKKTAATKTPTKKTVGKKSATKKPGRKR
jgi:predicted enzyme related to lactoylglutathione lyase